MKLIMSTQIYLLLMICIIETSYQLSGIPPLQPLPNAGTKDMQEEIQKNEDSKSKPAIIKLEGVNSVKKDLNNGANANLNQTNSTVKPSVPQKPTKEDEKVSDSESPQIESGSMIRGVLVFVGLAMIFILYLGCKTYSKRRPGNPIVRKYGVRTRRSDVEMRPLPLDDEDEDETVFDVGNLNKS